MERLPPDIVGDWISVQLDELGLRRNNAMTSSASDASGRCHWRTKKTVMADRPTCMPAARAEQDKAATGA